MAMAMALCLLSSLAREASSFRPFLHAFLCCVLLDLLFHFSPHGLFLVLAPDLCCCDSSHVRVGVARRGNSAIVAGEAFVIAPMRRSCLGCRVEWSVGESSLCPCLCCSFCCCSRRRSCCSVVGGGSGCVDGPRVRSPSLMPRSISSAAPSAADRSSLTIDRLIVDHSLRTLILGFWDRPKSFFLPSSSCRQCVCQPLC